MEARNSKDVRVVGLGPTFRAVVTTVVPSAGDLDQAAWGELEGLVSLSLEQRPRELRRRLFLFIRAVEWLPLFRFGRRFTALSPEKRTRFLSSLEHSRAEPLRLGFWGLRTLALLGYYARPAAAEEIGYRPSAAGWDAYRP